MRRIMSRQSGLFKPPFEHIRSVGAPERPARQLSRLSVCGREKKRTWLGAEAGRPVVFVQQLLEFVMDRELLFFGAFFFKPE